ncbi:MAG: hypothetical protein H9533_15170 [Rhodobacteraceae bacterium]|nr:hypothetical protein [Paracoccaceae bacterium]
MTPTRTSRTINQQIAETEAKLARLKTRKKASDTRRKIIVGAITITEALKDPKVARWLATTLRRNATREVDQKELTGLLAELDARAKNLPPLTSPPSSGSEGASGLSGAAPGASAGTFGTQDPASGGGSTGRGSQELGI